MKVSTSSTSSSAIAARRPQRTSRSNESLTSRPFIRENGTARRVICSPDRHWRTVQQGCNPDPTQAKGRPSWCGFRRYVRGAVLAQAAPSHHLETDGAERLAVGSGHDLESGAPDVRALSWS